MPYLYPGAHTLLRFRRLGPVSFALPVTVVADSPVETRLFLAANTPVRRRVLQDGSVIPRDMPYHERSKLPHIVGDATWHTHHTLRIYRPGDAHSVLLYWSETWEFRFWYINLEAPWQRRPHAFDTADHVLDIVVRPDRSWQWKDEDEFRTAIDIGRFVTEEAHAIRAEGERAIQRLHDNDPVFDNTLTAWRPPTDWRIPTLPPNWNDG